jgi:hypothetical protein
VLWCELAKLVLWCELAKLVLWCELAKLYSRNFISFPIANYISRYTWSFLSLSLSLNPLTRTGHRPILKSKLHCMSQDLIPTRPVVFVFVFYFIFFNFNFFILKIWNFFPKKIENLVIFTWENPKKITKFSQIFF